MTSKNCNEITANEVFDIDEVLVKAVFLGDVAAVQQAIRTGGNVNAAVVRNTPPLYAACTWGGEDEIVRILLDAGADPRWIRENDFTARTSPVGQACFMGHVSIVEILINHDNSLLEFVDDNDRGVTLLFNAILGGKVDVVRFLINRGANVFATLTGPKDGRTTLMVACQQGNVEIVRLLLAAGVEIETSAHYSRTALHYAVLYSNIEAMRELILHHNANMFVLNSSKETPFDMACRGTYHHSMSATIDPLLQMHGIKMTQEHGRLTLHAILRAAEYSFLRDHSFRTPLNPLRIILPLGKLTLNHFRTLLHSLDTDLIRNRDDRGKLPIHIACQTNTPVEVLALILELDPTTLHIADHSGTLPLHECCQGMVDYSSVRYLVEQGGVGTTTARNRQGALPLHVLCGSTNPSQRTIQYLVQFFPAAVETQTYSGQYPFMVAACETASASLSVIYELVRAHPDLLAPGK